MEQKKQLLQAILDDRAIIEEFCDKIREELPAHTEIYEFALKDSTENYSLKTSYHAWKSKVIYKLLAIFGVNSKQEEKPNKPASDPNKAKMI